MTMSMLRSLAFSLFGVAALAGSVHAEETHTVKAPAGKAAVGTPGVVSVTIEGRNGWHLNAEAPISLKIAAPPGVTVAKSKLGRGDLAESTDTKARFDVSATLAEAGVKTMAGEASFVVCQESACKPVKENITLTLASDSVIAPATKTKARVKASPPKRKV